MNELRKLATKGKNANVLFHTAGYFKDELGPEEKAELHETIADYRRGLVPLVVPVTLLRHYVRRHGSTCLEGPVARILVGQVGALEGKQVTLVVVGPEMSIVAADLALDYGDA